MLLFTVFFGLILVPIMKCPSPYLPIFFGGQLYAASSQSDDLFRNMLRRVSTSPNYTRYQYFVTHISKTEAGADCAKKPPKPRKHSLYVHRQHTIDIFNWFVICTSNF